SGDIEHLGRLISESGASSIENYECGSPALVDLYEILADTPGVYGTRFSGAGSQGCCIALVNPEHVDAIAEHVLERYSPKQGTLAKQAEVIRVETDNGARWL
ncbi:MAG: galactokinase, partial [Gammaproteobacteria bacterium]|nr:galactokinase [Gammaproteobacteria bacterium]